MTESNVMHLVNESKKVLDRLTAKCVMNSSNSINYIENELEMQQIKGKYLLKISFRGRLLTFVRS